MNQETYLFTSESVTEGHPDKVADQISDAILDAILAQDPKGRVACETLVTTGLAFIAGEITTRCYVDMPQIIRETIREIGYTSSQMGFDYQTCAVITSIDQQSPDIAMGVNRQGLDQGAGDQGLMFGFASDETPELMPMPIMYAHKLTRRLAEVRKKGILDFLRPDGKSQVTISYENGMPRRVDTVVVSTQHTPDVTQEEIRDAVVDLVIKEVIPEEMLDDDTKYFINPTGRFVVGGPMGDCGVRPQNHCRHLRRTGEPWRGLLFRQGSFQGGPERQLHGQTHCKKHRGRGTGPQVRGTDRLCHRRCPAGIGDG